MTIEVDQQRFDAERRRLTALAYRMTGTPDDADDVVQEVWIRWQRTDRAAIDNDAAWLTTVTTRVAIDRLGSARARRELYVGPWVPEPMPSSSDGALSADPAEVQELSDAFLAAILEGDVDRLTSMLTDDVVHISDGGPDHHAARRPVRGPDKVARLFVNLARREWLPIDELHWVDVNGQPGAYVVRDGEPYLLTVLNWRDRQVAEAIAIVNPDKLRHFHDSWSNGQLGLHRP